MCIHNQPDHGHFCEGMYIYNFNCLVYQQLLNQLAIFFLSPVSQQMCVEILRAQEFGAREPYTIQKDSVLKLQSRLDLMSFDKPHNYDPTTQLANTHGYTMCQYCFCDGNHLTHTQDWVKFVILTQLATLWLLV